MTVSSLHTISNLQGIPIEGGRLIKREDHEFGEDGFLTDFEFGGLFDKVSSFIGLALFS